MTMDIEQAELEAKAVYWASLRRKGWSYKRISKEEPDRPKWTFIKAVLQEYGFTQDGEPYDEAAGEVGPETFSVSQDGDLREQLTALLNLVDTLRDKDVWLVGTIEISLSATLRVGDDD